MKRLILSPEEKDLQEQIAVARSARAPLLIKGHDTWQSLGAKGAQVLGCPESFCGPRDYSPKDLVITLGCGTPVRELDPILAEHSQQLPLLQAYGDQGTVGGLLGMRPGGGHRRPGHGSLRERLVALRFLTGAGQIHQSGTRVAKNVAGYDLPRLLLGSRGTLALGLEATFQVAPKLPGESLRISGELESIEALCEELATRRIPWLGLTVLNAEATVLLFPECAEDHWSLVVGLEDRERAVKAALKSVEDSSLLRSCELQRSSGTDHEALWDSLDGMPGALKDRFPTWQRLHTTGTEAIATLIRGVPRGTPATARRLCGFVDLYFPGSSDMDRRVSYSEESWLRQLYPWRPSLECARLSRSHRDLFRSLKAVFDPDSLFPSLLGEEKHA